MPPLEDIRPKKKLRFKDPQPKHFPNYTHTIFSFIKMPTTQILLIKLSHFSKSFIKVIFHNRLSVLKHFRILFRPFSQILIYCTCYYFYRFMPSKQGNSFPYVHSKFSFGAKCAKIFQNITII